MSNNTYSLHIPAGTLVLSEKRGMVELKAPANIRGAFRMEDGAFTYRLGENYICSAGTCSFVAETVSA